MKRISIIILTVLIQLNPGILRAQRVGDDLSVSMDRPKNLSRLNLGTRFAVIEQRPLDGKPLPEELLLGILSDDPSQEGILQSGSYSFVVMLSDVQMIRKVSFLNLGLTGDVRVGTSTVLWPMESHLWNQGEMTSVLDDKDVITFQLVGLDAKYIRFDFHIRGAGRMASLGVYGDRLEKDYHLKTSTDSKEPVDSKLKNKASLIDFAASYSKSEVVYVSSSLADENPELMIDDLLETGFTFDPSDPAPTLVVNFKGKRTVDKVVCYMKASPGFLKTYMMHSVPWDTSGVQTAFNHSWPSSFMTSLGWMIVPMGIQSSTTIQNVRKDLPKGFFDTLNPTQVVSTGSSGGVFSLDFKGVQGQYLALRWTPDPNYTGEVQPLVIRKLGAFSSIEMEDHHWELVYAPAKELIDASTPVKLDAQNQSSQDRDFKYNMKKLIDIVPPPPPPPFVSE